MILVALNFLVAVDIIETLIKPAHSYEMTDLFKLALIAAVRTILAYFLAKETEELEHELLKHHATHESRLPHTRHGLM